MTTGAFGPKKYRQKLFQLNRKLPFPEKLLLSASMKVPLWRRNSPMFFCAFFPPSMWLPLRGRPCCLSTWECIDWQWTMLKHTGWSWEMSLAPPWKSTGSLTSKDPGLTGLPATKKRYVSIVHWITSFPGDWRIRENEAVHWTVTVLLSVIPYV